MGAINEAVLMAILDPLFHWVQCDSELSWRALDSRLEPKGNLEVVRFAIGLVPRRSEEGTVDDVPGPLRFE